MLTHVSRQPALAGEASVRKAYRTEDHLIEIGLGFDLCRDAPGREGVNMRRVMIAMAFGISGICALLSCPPEALSSGLDNLNLETFEESAVRVSWAAKEALADLGLRVVWKNAAGDSVVFVPIKDVKWWPTPAFGLGNTATGSFWDTPTKSNIHGLSVAKPEPRISVNGVEPPASKGDSADSSFSHAILLVLYDRGNRETNAQFYSVKRRRDPVSEFWRDEAWVQDRRSDRLFIKERTKLLETMHLKLAEPEYHDDETEKTGLLEW